MTSSTPTDHASPAGVRVEVALDDVGGAAAARAGGADRVELCAALDVGGTTPSLGFVLHAAAEAGPLGLQVLLRPRGGDFVLDEDETAVVLADVAAVRSALGDDPRLGFTFGALTPEGRIDLPVVARVVEACGPHPVVFHKAFDTAVVAARSGGEPAAGLTALVEEVVEAGVAAVLTAGGDGPVVDHLDPLAELVAAAGDRLRVVAGGGVRPANVRDVVAATGCREVHLRATRPVPSRSRVASAQYDAAERLVTSADVVADLVARLGAPGS